MTATPAAVRARTLGCEIEGQVHDLLLIGETLYVLRLGAAKGSTVDASGLLKIIHWAAVLYTRIGPRGLAGGHPDSSPDGAGAEIGRARLRVASAPESQLLRLDAASLKADAAGLKAHRLAGLDVVELHGVFSGAKEPAGRRTLRVELAGDPVASLERLLGMAGIPLRDPGAGADER